MSKHQLTSHTLRVEGTAEIISIYRNGLSQPLLIQHATPDKRPYIHPILAPDGIGILTEDAPDHHPWQHGLYVGLNDINGIGFWEEGLGNRADGTFHPKPLGVPVLMENQVKWRVETDWRDPEGERMLTEEQAWTFTDLGDAYELDVEWSLQAKVELNFGRYEYGGLFLRMPYREEWGGVALNSEGQQNQEAEAHRARWVSVSMPIEGRKAEASMTMMDHAGNPEFPVPWRVDAELGVAPSRCIAGAWQLREDQKVTYRHRLLITGQESNVNRIEQSWSLFNKEEK